jgi:hypothetical protein
VGLAAHFVLGVVDDETELLGVQPNVQRVENCTQARHRMIALQMLVRVPHEGGNAIAAPDARLVKRAAQALRPLEVLLPRVQQRSPSQPQRRTQFRLTRAQRTHRESDDTVCKLPILFDHGDDVVVRLEACAPILPRYSLLQLHDDAAIHQSRTIRVVSTSGSRIMVDIAEATLNSLQPCVTEENRGSPNLNRPAARG